VLGKTQKERNLDIFRDTPMHSHIDAELSIRPFHEPVDIGLLKKNVRSLFPLHTLNRTTSNKGYCIVNLLSTKDDGHVLY